MYSIQIANNWPNQVGVRGRVLKVGHRQILCNFRRCIRTERNVCFRNSKQIHIYSTRRAHIFLSLVLGYSSARPEARK